MKRTCIAILVLGLLWGCGDSKNQYVGKYSGKYEPTERFIDTIMSAPGMEGLSREQVKAELSGTVWHLELKADGTYSTDEDSGMWRLDDNTGMLHITIPATFKQSAIENFNANPVASARFGDKYLRDVPDLRLRIVDDGQTLWFDTNDLLVDSGIDLESIGVDPKATSMRFVFVRD